MKNVLTIECISSAEPETVHCVQIRNGHHEADDDIQTSADLTKTK